MKIENYTEATKKSLYNSGTLEDLITEISTNVTREDLRRDSTVMSCISVLSGYIASMSLQLFKTREKDSIRINNDLTELLKRPNILYNYFDFIKEALQEMLINKEVFIKISTKKGQVIGLDIIKNATLFETSKQYFVGGMINNQTVKVNYANCLHFRDSFDRFKALENIIATKKSVSKLINRSYDSNLQNVIKGIITVEGEALSDDTKIYLKRAFNKVLNSGEDNIAVLEEGMKFDSIQGNGVQSYSFAESQVKEILAIQDDKIHQIFNVPKVLTSISEGSYNLSEAQKSLFIESLLPVIKMIENEMTYKLLTSIERETMYFRINYESILRGSSLDRANFYKTMKETGLMTIEEIRAKENLPYIDGTDDLMASLNYVPLSEWKEYVTRRDTVTSVPSGTEQ
ncbi:MULTISPECIES: phage portal protein [Clostridium]|uniref:phage portal protein n=1 Tax=Clostridium TaxID=1485 RepID=UPI0006BF5BD7|nr:MULTISPECIES: phage portal protein [Clostridium]MDU7455136.1 phage portal protein [Clostridium saudiense]CUN58881.1 phage portal protein%2C HK97 family [Clostridium disporicum]SCJ17103.1 phage portal protein%2C HK97 family [uncultured Clostridium sp.]